MIYTIDGDSIKAHCPQHSKSPLSIRLWGIDAPELGQSPWGDNSKKALQQFVESSDITLFFYEKDRYNRFIAKLFYQNEDIGLKMVENGFAVVYHRYNNDLDYKKKEKTAKIAKVGIWKKKGAQQNPEKWRRFTPFKS